MRHVTVCNGSRSMIVCGKANQSTGEAWLAATGLACVPACVPPRSNWRHWPALHQLLLLLHLFVLFSQTSMSILFVLFSQTSMSKFICIIFTPLWIIYMLEFLPSLSIFSLRFLSQSSLIILFSLAHLPEYFCSHILFWLFHSLLRTSLSILLARSLLSSLFSKLS